MDEELGALSAGKEQTNRGHCHFSR